VARLGLAENCVSTSESTLNRRECGGLKSLFASTTCDALVREVRKNRRLRAIPVREERDSIVMIRMGVIRPSPNAVQKHAVCVGSVLRTADGPLGFVFSPSENPKHLCGSDGALAGIGDVHKGFWRSLYRVNFLTLALTWPWDHQTIRILVSMSRRPSVPLVGSNRFRRYLRCRSYCSATRRRSFQHQRSGTKTRRQLVNRTSSDLRIEQICRYRNSPWQRKKQIDPSYTKNVER